MTKLDILSDPICPWCLIGYTFLKRALQQRSDHDFEIEWHPYMLNPQMTAKGMDRLAYLNSKFGSKENAQKVYNEIEKTASVNEIKINLSNIKRTPNTLDAHRLIHWAGPEKQQDVVDLLFEEYFIKGNDISDHQVLISIVNKIGLEFKISKDLLKSEKDKINIKNRIQNASEKGVYGVPCFIVANTYVLQGAQPTELWLRVINELIDKNV